MNLERWTPLHVGSYFVKKGYDSFNVAYVPLLGLRI